MIKLIEVGAKSITGLKGGPFNVLFVNLYKWFHSYSTLLQKYYSHRLDTF